MARRLCSLAARSSSIDVRSLAMHCLSSPGSTSPFSGFYGKRKVAGCSAAGPRFGQSSSIVLSTLPAEPQVPSSC